MGTMWTHFGIGVTFQGFDSHVLCEQYLNRHFPRQDIEAVTNRL